MTSTVRFHFSSYPFKCSAFKGIKYVVACNLHNQSLLTHLAHIPMLFAKTLVVKEHKILLLYIWERLYLPIFVINDNLFIVRSIRRSYVRSHFSRPIRMLLEIFLNEFSLENVLKLKFSPCWWKVQEILRKTSMKTILSVTHFLQYF